MASRINNRTDLRHYYKTGDIAYSTDREMYFDPSNGKLYNSDASCVGKAWEYFCDTSVEDFFYVNSVRADLDAPPRKSHIRHSYHRERRYDGWDMERRTRRSYRSPNDRIVNFLALGTMSTCNETDRSGPHPSTSWERQRPCNFASKSITQNKCMFWNGDLDGHCSCYKAYAHKTGAETFDKRELIKQQIADEEGKNFDHHFEEAEKLGLAGAKELYKQDQLDELSAHPNQLGPIYYYKKWDVFFNKYGEFLRELTEYRRKHDAVPSELAYRWNKNLIGSVT